LYLLLCVAVFLAVSCGNNSSTSSSVAATYVTSAITAGDNLESFTYHSNTAYKANFGAAGLGISGATSAGEAGHDIASYSWEQIGGPAVTFTSDTASVTATFDAPAMTSMLHTSDQYRWQVLPVSRDDAVAVFRLTVADAAGNTDAATFDVYLFDGGNEIKTSAGLTNVGIGEKVYLAGPSWKANSSTASTAVTDWAWVLTAPAGSAAALSDAVSQIVDFTPDVEGTYTITYSSVTAGIAGSTLDITAGNYVGTGTINDATPDSSTGQCGACHNGTVEEDMTSEWQETGHSSIFQQVIGYYKSKAPDTSADNGGFDDLVSDAGYSFPSAGTTWDDFTTDNSTLTPLTNVQCENCHGPGSIHTGTYQKWNSGICAKCHPQESEWKISGHNSTGVIGSAGRYRVNSTGGGGSWTGVGCVRCHTGAGFAQEVADEELTAQTSDDIGIQCQACHDSHSVAADTPSGGATSISGNDSTQLRVKGNVIMKDDARTVINAGKAAVCYECHDGNYSYNESDCDSNADGTADAVCETIDQAATQYHRMPHYNTQSFVLEGLGAVTGFSDSSYNFTLTENSFHTSDLFTLRYGSGDSSQSNENDKCVTCHMGTAPEEEETGYLLVGGHTWKVDNGSVSFTSGCTTCHTTLTDFNRMARADYDGDSSIEGIQDEISGLLLALANKLKSIDATNLAGGTTQADDGSITVAALTYGASTSQATMNLTNIDVRRAVYNYNLIVKDNSLGVHNAAFAVQLLQKTYTAISAMNGGNSFATDYPNAMLR
ncbi:MAG: hypothetical protein HYU98_01815, partial [Deltaproteobacteria bacterium]|nr:hypothetical protein [Deltaproteobacteria bacterium]